MAGYGPKMAIYQLLFFGNSPNLHGASDYIWGHNFWPNQDLEPLSTSKGEHITDIYITETGTTELENLSHNIIDIFIIET